MNINEPISNPKLVDAIEGLSDNNVTQQKFFEEFVQAKLLCPADIQLKNSLRDGNEIVVGEGSSIYDVNPYVKGQNRGAERIVIGDDGSVWYTNDHYMKFTQTE